MPVRIEHAAWNGASFQFSGPFHFCGTTFQYCEPVAGQSYLASVTANGSSLTGEFCISNILLAQRRMAFDLICAPYKSAGKVCTNFQSLNTQVCRDFSGTAK
jgi:hypothetical protein